LRLDNKENVAIFFGKEKQMNTKDKEMLQKAIEDKIAYWFDNGRFARKEVKYTVIIKTIPEKKAYAKTPAEARKIVVDHLKAYYAGLVPITPYVDR
jgi:hypothetical protein